MTESTTPTHEPGTHPDLAPPSTDVGIRGWMYHNLFSGWFNSIVTVLSAALIGFLLYELLPWLFFDAYWSGNDRSACPAPGEGKDGACWVYIKIWFKQMMYGRYPDEALWRINSAYVLLVGALLPLIVPRMPEGLFEKTGTTARTVGGLMIALAAVFAFTGATSWFVWIAIWAAVTMFVGYGFLLAVGYPVIAVLLFLIDVNHPHIGPESTGWSIFLTVLLAAQGLAAFADRIWKRFSYKGALGVFLVFVFPLICVYLFHGGGFGLEEVETPLWGGLFLTLVIALTGIVMSLPVGVVLALGRRSNMPVVKSLCVVFIELWRGVPLITVLFMASVMFPLFMPEGVNFDKLLRALVGVIFFASAYMAEVVRGGLQAIPKGQYEAADALGLSYWKKMGLVILPQALKITIPGVVNTFIGLFKDTTLVLIIGLFDFLGMAQAVSTNPDWLGFYVEGYVFVAFGFWVFCFGMSRYSIYLERKLETGHKR